MSVRWIEVLTFYEPQGRRKRPLLEVIDNDGEVRRDYGRTLDEASEIAKLNGLEPDPETSSEYVVVWRKSRTS